MPRKQIISQQQILDTAFEIIRQQGEEALTARSVAQKAECSTQPIFRVYRSMDELYLDVYEKSADFFEDFYVFYPKMGKNPYVNLGMAYIAFAKSEKNLFRFLFLSKWKHKTMLELMDGKNANVSSEINRAIEEGYEDAEGLFTEMWMFVHGAACMALTDDYHFSDVQLLALLERTYGAFAEKLV